jgi:hypothetical protein
MHKGDQNNPYSLNIGAASYSETSLSMRLHSVKHQEAVIDLLYDTGLNAAREVRLQPILL